MIKVNGNIYFSAKTEDMDLDMIFEFVKNSYWGTIRTYEEQKIALENSINFGLFKHGKQIAYSRVMTDMIFFAYLLDVFVIDEEQGNGYGQLLMDKILSYPSLKNIDKWMLATRDAHSLYEKFGFEVVKSPEKLMDRMSDRAKEIYE
ncbi:GNAT family N-acetyltransferase [Flavobacteriaceae bacterium S356]|uniref:GNAT family N-acetyltransferase n=1 Tax=Asprobacillus argus TaxID=3076534 RepID=A0ABU3LIB1_9FLAO|nr:GNAT family N-acetyltransferase [Flavobacteriaceae bacterium S356]